jgi:hypothetical protein
MNTTQTTYSEIRSLARTVDAGKYLITYEDSGVTDAEDPGSRCGMDDTQLSEIEEILSGRGLTLDADDRGLVVSEDVRR